MTKRLEQQLAFISELDKMKHILRRTLVSDGSRYENDAEHSWHIATMALVLKEYAPEGADALKAAALCLVHDLVEIYAGDTFCYDVEGNRDKAARESAAADKLYGILPVEQGKLLREMWEEFDKGETPEAKYANALDRLQPTMLNYNTQGMGWKKTNPKESQVRERLQPVKDFTPELFEFCENAIQFGIEKDYIKK